jgi:nitrogen fixation protein NifX
MTTATQEPAIAREVALRIGLAARALPNTEPRRLLELLAEKLGLPLTEEKLAQVTVTQLKDGLAGPDGGEDADQSGGTVTIPQYKEAVRYLWGELGVEDNLPGIEPYAEGDMPGSIRIALSSKEGEAVDGHFGSCSRFLVYQVDQNQSRLIAIRSTVGAYEAEDSNQYRADLIKDCQVLYVVSIGGPAAAKVIKAGIYPIKLSSEESARAVIAKFQGVLAGSPPPWLAKIMGKSAEERVRFDREDDWEEEEEA